LSLKVKISILHIIISFVTTFFIYMIYDTYIVSQEKSIDNNLEKILKLNKQNMTKSLIKINKMILNQAQLTKKIHLHVHNLLKKNTYTNLEDLRKIIQKHYHLDHNNLDLEIFLIDKNYIVSKSTHPKNIGYDLKSSKKSTSTLNKLNKIDRYELSKDVSIDFLDYEIKNYSYSKLKTEEYLGISFIYKNTLHLKKAFYATKEIANTNMEIFCVIKDNNNKQYFKNITTHKKFISKKDQLHNKQRFPLNLHTTNKIINASRTWKKQYKKNNNILNIYVPLMKEKNPYICVPGDIILQVDLDISNQNAFTNTILNKLIIFIILHFILVFLIFYFTNKYHKIEKKLEKELEKNKQLIDYNKQFISNTVHQIRTPLAIIMTNVSLLEILIKNNIQSYSAQINASINLLSNSYENLSYYISYENLRYPKRELNVSNQLEERINFFEHVSKANKKNMYKNITQNIFLTLNDIELERLLDNSIAHIIYYCDVDENIFITFYPDEDKYILRLKAKTNKEPKDMPAFNKKKFIINDTSTFGLGTYLVQMITKKNTIQYSLEKKDGTLTIEYVFKKGY